MFVVLGLALFGGLFSIVVDFDHIWVWILHSNPPFIFQGTITTAGRPFHVWYVFLFYSVVVSAWLTPLVVRYLQSNIFMEVKSDGEQT